MATYVSNSTKNIDAGSSTGATISINTPAGASSGDTIWFGLLCKSTVTSSFVAQDTQTKVVDWVTGVYDEPFYGYPALSVWKVEHDGARTTYDWTYDQNTDRGGGIIAVCYSGDNTVRQTATDTDTDGTGSRDGPSMTGTSGNTLLVFHGGSAVSATVTFGGGFTERVDYEWYGLNGAADVAASGSSQTASVTPSASSQSVWALLEIGANGGGGSNMLLLGVG